MSNKNIDDKRSSLNFCSEVKIHFNYLCSEFGYQCTEESLTHVRFASSVSYVTIFHGRLSYEIDVEFGLILLPIKFRLSEILSSSDETAMEIRVPYQSSTKEGVQKGVLCLSGVIKKYYSLLIQGEVNEFNRLEQQVTKYREVETNRIVNAPVREKAEKAWRGKNLKEVIFFYKDIKGPLTRSEKNRLEYALNKSKSREIKTKQPPA